MPFNGSWFFDICWVVILVESLGKETVFNLFLWLFSVEKAFT